MNPMIHLRRAKAALQGAGSARSRLLTAGREFWEALFAVTAWPADLCEAADPITTVLLVHGATMDAAVAHMDEVTVQQTLQGLSEFCDRAESLLSN